LADARKISWGDVVPSYPYLWLWQRDRGEEEGRKDRPICVAVATRGPDGLTHLALLAITGTSPREDQLAVEIPPLEIRRLGLSQFKQAWIIVSEYSYDILERSFSLDPPSGPGKKLSPGFLKVVLRVQVDADAGSSPRRSSLEAGCAADDRPQERL
jgi:hypothetical protein